MTKNGRLALSLSALLFAASAGVAFAADTPTSGDDQSAPRSAGNQPDMLADMAGSDVWTRDQLFGKMGGLRPWLGNYGITIGLTETSELLGNTSGGVKRGFDYDGLTTLTLQLDTARAFGLPGGLINASGLNVHGSNLSSHNLQSLQTASGIEADNGFRLWELWYQQSFWGNQADVKIGQQSLDQEFMVSTNALLFVNTMFGWPMIPSADLLSGGPAYPLSSPGIRLHLAPAGAWSLLAGVFDDNPSGISATSDEDSQRLNRFGTNFRTSDKPLFIAEIQYSTPAMGEIEYGDQLKLPGTYKLGGWLDAGRFADQRYGTDGLSLADPASNGNPALRHGNASLYAVADQMLWRENAESLHSVSAFFRGMTAPSGRNLIDYSLNAGLTYREPFEGREDDTFGIGFGYAHVSGADSGLDSDAGLPIKRSAETFIEATYQYTLFPWLVLQPDVQYVFNPGGGITDPNNPNATKRLGNETVFGVRTNITF